MRNLILSLIILTIATPIASAQAQPCADQEPRKVTERELDNLVAFSKLLGYVRYFHPSDESAVANWDIVAIEGLDAVEKAKNAEDLAARLEKFFKPIAPSIKVFATGKRPKDFKIAEPKEATRVMAWRHLSVPPPRAVDKYSSMRIDLKREKELPITLKVKVKPPLPDPTTPFEADLSGGVSCLVPLALFADNMGTLPRGDKNYLKQFTSRRKDFVPSGKDRATRLATVALAWNSVQHFYVYFDVLKVDWPAELRLGLTRASTDSSDLELVVTLRRLLAGLHDGHVAVLSKAGPTPYYPPIRWDWVEDRLTIVTVDKEAKEKLQPGDVVLKIDGQLVQKLMDQRCEKMGTESPNLKRRMGMMLAAAATKPSDMALEVQTGEMPARKVVLKRSLGFREFRNLMTEPRPAPISEIKPGYWYIDVERAQTKDFKAAAAKFEKASGLIFDVRGYPRIELDLFLEHLVEKPADAVPVYMPLIYHPDRKHLTFIQGRSGVMEPKAPRWKARVSFLTDARAISTAETLVATVQHHKLATVFGSPTAGANGNIRLVKLPANIEIQFTGIKVLNYDGSTFHTRGVIPDVAIQRTLKGVTQNRDEVLEAALKRLEG